MGTALFHDFVTSPFPVALHNSPAESSKNHSPRGGTLSWMSVNVNRPLIKRRRPTLSSTVWVFRGPVDVIVWMHPSNGVGLQTDVQIKL